MIKKLQQYLFSLFFLLTDANYRKIRASGIFDAAFYLAANPDVAEGGRHPLVHYFRGGWRENRSPHLLFDISFYFNQIPEIRETGVEPILHFINEGWKSGLKPSPYFDPLFYAAKNSGVDFSKLNPLSHFIRQGWEKNQDVPPYIDLNYYLSKNSDIADSGLSPLEHYITIGRQEKRQPGPFFDVAWYLDRTPILQEMAQDVLVHYALFGIWEGKSPCPVFDPGYYRATCKDEIDRRKDPLAHYLLVGEHNGFQPCAWFDPDFYKKTYLNDGSSSALGHYLAEGVNRGNYPNRIIADLSAKPIISIIVPVYNVAAHHLNNCIRSVLYQSYPHWQLCLADDCSTSPHVKPLLAHWAAQDSRIKVAFLEKNQGIAGATNAAAELATGGFYGFLDNDDELAAECLYRVVKAIAESGADLLYTDEDLIGEDGRRFNVFYKPGYNAELLLCHNYVTHLVVTAADLFQKVGGMEAERAGAQDYDLFLKLSEQSRKIVHIPEVLYHWRASETSTSINHSQKEYADEAGRQSVLAALQRRDIDAEVIATEWKYFYRTKRDIYLLPLVSIVVFWDQQDRNPAGWLQRLISKTTYKNYQVILLYENETELSELKGYLQSIDQPVRIVEVKDKLGLSTLYNAALPYCDGEYVAFVSSDVTILDANWLSTLLEYCQVPETGAVCGRLCNKNPLYPEISPLPDMQNASVRYHAQFLQQASVLLNGLQCPQNIWNVTWECCLIKKEALDQCGGFAADLFPEIYAIHDLSLQLLEQDLQIFYTPYCHVDWQADARRFSQDFDGNAGRAERAAFQKKWRSTLISGDPFFNRAKLQEKHILPEEFQNWLSGPVLAEEAGNAGMA